MKNDKKEKKSNSKERRLPRFHIFDAVIILLVIAICVGVYFRYSVFDMLGNLKDQSEANITFSVEDVRYTTETFVKMDDRVYFKSSGETFGTIMESRENSSIPLECTPVSQTFIEGGNAITVNYPLETRIDAKGRIKCSGVFSQDGSFMLNGATYISAGQSFVVCTEKVTLEITIVSIEKA